MNDVASTEIILNEVRKPELFYKSTVSFTKASSYEPVQPVYLAFRNLASFSHKNGFRCVYVRSQADQVAEISVFATGILLTGTKYFTSKHASLAKGRDETFTQNSFASTK